jgi:hypothetical protein
MRLLDKLRKRKLTDVSGLPSFPQEFELSAQDQSPPDAHRLEATIATIDEHVPEAMINVLRTMSITPKTTTAPI